MYKTPKEVSSIIPLMYKKDRGSNVLVESMELLKNEITHGKPLAATIMTKPKLFKKFVKELNHLPEDSLLR